MNPFDKEPSTVPTLAATHQREVPQCMQQPPNNGTSGLPPPTTLSQRPTILPQPTTLNRQPTIPLTHPITPTGTSPLHFRPKLKPSIFPPSSLLPPFLSKAPTHAKTILTRTSSLPYYSSYYYNGYVTTITSYLPCPTSTVIYYTQECPENCPTTVINPDGGTTTLTEYVSTPTRIVNAVTSNAMSRRVIQGVVFGTDRSQIDDHNAVPIRNHNE